MKILIIGTTNSPVLDVAKGLQAANDDLQIAPVFTTDLKMKGKVGESVYYMANEEVELAYKNNAFMWVHTKDHYSTGVTRPDMYSSSLFTMSFGDFNNISNPVMQELAKDDDCVLTVGEFENEILAQSVRHEVYQNTKNIRELIMARAYEKPASIIDCILKYIGSTPEEREKIEESLNN